MTALNAIVCALYVMILMEIALGFVGWRNINKEKSPPYLAMSLVFTSYIAFTGACLVADMLGWLGP